MSALVGWCTYSFYHLRVSFIYVGQERYSSFHNFHNANCTYSGKNVLSTGVAKYELLGTASDSVIHANGRIPLRRTNWQTLTDGMYGNGEVVYSVRSGLCWQADLCLGDTAFPTKALLLPLNLPTRANSGTDRSRAHEDVYCTREEISLCQFYWGRSNDYGSSWVLN